jgi:hypothetical protein
MECEWAAGYDVSGPGWPEENGEEGGEGKKSLKLGKEGEKLACWRS